MLIVMFTARVRSTKCSGAKDNKGCSFVCRRGLLAYVYTGVSVTTIDYEVP